MNSSSSASAMSHSPNLMQRSLRPLVVLGLLLFGLSLSAFAQTATIVGTVTDPSGSVVPHATITATSVETSQSRTITTGDDGQFVLPDLQIGHYTIRAEAAGFKIAEQKDVALSVGDRARINFPMELGGNKETVTVEATAVRVQSDTGEVSSLISGQQLNQLATNGRSMYSLANLTPGASSGQGDFQTPTPVGGDANISYNGLRMSHNLYMLDGSESSDRGGGGGSDVMPSMDALGEFRIMTSNYSAEFGLSSAATMTAVIKSGTKQLHASGWEFTRNDALDARNYFNPAPNKVAKLRFHTYGFNVGGQVPLWKSHPTFFFYNMEWRSLIQGGLTNQTVPLTSTYGGNLTDAGLTLDQFHAPYTCQISPTQQQRFADAGQSLSGCMADPNDATKQIPNPAAQVAFTNQTIATSLLDPNTQALLGAGIFPAPTSGKQFIGGNDSPTKVREEIVRIDHQFSEKFSVFGHYLTESINQTFGTAMWSGDNVPTVSNTFGNPSRSAVIHTTYVINPRLLNEVAFNYNGNQIDIVPQGVVEQPSGFSVPRLFSGPNNLNRIPEINLGGATGAHYQSASWPWHNKADDYQIRDDISWTLGSHQIRMGASWAIYKKIQDLFGQTQGGFTFNNNYTGNDFGDFLLGYANQYQELAVQDSGYWNNVSWAAYIQDNWRVNHRLTLNLGLRWDGVPHTYEANDRMGNFYSQLYDPAKAALVNDDGTINPASPGLGTSPNPILANTLFYLNGIGIPGQNGVPKGLVDNHWAAFGPRIGFAYDLTGGGKTVLRGGFGTMYERIQGNDMYNAGPNIPFSGQVTFNNILLSNPNTSIATGQTLVAPINAADITGLNRTEYKLPVSYQYSIGIQQQLGAKSVLSASYVGNQNRHQNDYREMNRPDPSVLPALATNTAADHYNELVPFAGFHSIRLSETVQNSHYNSFQSEFRSQLRRDLTIQAAYTLSRAVDPATNANGVGDLQNVSNPYSYTYDDGPSGLDRTHIFFVNFVYDLPVFRNSSNRLLKSTLGGWQVSGIVTAVTGNPLNISQGGRGNNISNILPNTNNRPDLTGSIGTPHKVDQWFDTSAFSDPAPGTFGNTPFNAVRGPSRQNWNVALFKSFVISESRGSRIELRAESFNTWNHTEFNAVSTTFANDNFGAVTTAHDPREIQLGLKAYF
jgi:hypothetical protein